MFGPDGKLYFNFGNAGEQICDAQGHPIVDMAGNRVAETMKPYQQGMVFRCNLDLSCFETLAWNFRNNWMVAVDSFGTIWQSDNDDDGNRGVRINYVMEFGNYGYRDEFTGAGWQTPRIGMSDDIANRHWHQNDPGVVPNVLHTGAGSPTGIAVYEGNALPEAFRGQLIHCDAGPSVTRAYQITDVGAGYAGHIVNLLEGTRDPWFRPSDVKVAPDGSLIVADWFDPGVGGHQMGDVDRGRLFRVTAKASSSGDSTGGPRYVMPRFDFSTPQGAVDALQNPNNAVRYLAWQSLHRSGAQAAEALEQLAAGGEPHDRARAYWLLGKIPGRGRNYVEQAAREPDARLRIVALRLARQIDELDPLSLVERLADDSSPQVRRECALALRGSDDPRAVDLWTRLALAHDGQDRWYLEALGIGAEGQWDRYLAAWLERVGPAWNAAPGREIVWRSRAVQTSELLRQLIEDPATPAAEIPRYLRALDFQPESARVAALERLAFHCSLPQGQRRELVQTQALYRMPAELLRNNVPRQQQLDRVLDSLAGTSEFIELVQRFGLQHRFDQVLQLAAERPTDATGIDAVRMLLAADQQTRLAEWIRQHPDQGQLAMIALLGRSADNRALPLLKQIMLDVNASPETRRAALQSLARLRAGAEFLLDQSQAQSLPVELMHAVAADLHQVPWDDLRARALELFPITPSKDNKSLRPLRELAELRGDVAKGEVVYRTGGTCIKCHVANGQGTAVGPELSEIGDKLSREAMIESIVYPSAGISHSFESYAVELEDGNIVSGLLVSQTDEAITLKSSEGIERRFARGDVAHFTRQPLSLMPADLHQNLTEAELIDLVEYLLTLKKP
jgi:putative heme-binding domain-containing protein